MTTLTNSPWLLPSAMMRPVVEDMQARMAQSVVLSQRDDQFLALSSSSTSISSSSSSSSIWAASPQDHNRAVVKTLTSYAKPLVTAQPEIHLHRIRERIMLRESLNADDRATLEHLLDHAGKESSTTTEVSAMAHPCVNTDRRYEHMTQQIGADQMRWCVCVCESFLSRMCDIEHNVPILLLEHNKSGGLSSRRSLRGAPPPPPPSHHRHCTTCTHCASYAWSCSSNLNKINRRRFSRPSIDLMNMLIMMKVMSRYVQVS